MSKQTNKGDTDIVSPIFSLFVYDENIKAVPSCGLARLPLSCDVQLLVSSVQSWEILRWTSALFGRSTF